LNLDAVTPAIDSSRFFEIQFYMAVRVRVGTAEQMHPALATLHKR
jgi:hypothetical protein